MPASDTRVHRIAKLVREFIALDIEKQRIDEQRKKAQEELMPLIEALGPQAWGDKVVKKIVNKTKRPTKEIIITYFGAPGALFWDTLKPESYEYLTVEQKKK